MRFPIIMCFLVSFGYNSKAQNPENFDIFLFRFASDKEFQLSRIEFPLKFKTWESSDLEEIIEKKISKSDWEHDFLFINESYRPQIYDNFEGELRDSNQRLFQYIGVENGINTKYFFERKDGEWFLIKKEDLGT